MARNKLSKKLLLAAAVAAMACCQSAFAETVEMDLEDAMLRAFNTNPAVEIAGYEMKSAKASYDAARASRYLSVSFNHKTGRGGAYDEQLGHKTKTGFVDAKDKDGNAFVGITSFATGEGYYSKGISNSHTNSFSATLPIYNGGATKGKILQSKASYKSAVAGQQGAWNEMRSTVTNGYFQVLQAENMAKLSQEAVDRLNEHLKNVQAQYDVGVVAKVDVLRSQVELSNAEQDLIKAQNGLDIAVASMDRIVGLPMDTELKLVNLLKYAPYENDINYCLNYAADHRPELEQAKQRVKAAEGALLVARSGYQPSINASGSHTLNKNKNWPGDGKTEWAVGIGVSMNIFDSGVTYSRIHGAKEDLSKAQAQYRDTVDGVNLDVRSKYLSLREAEKRIHTTDVAVERAEEDYRIAQLRYQAGVGTNTDVIDASVALTQAKVNYLQALYDYNTSKTDLKTAIGEPMTFPVKIAVEPVKTAEEQAK